MNARAKLQLFQVEPYSYYETLRGKKKYEVIDGAMPNIKWSHMVMRYDEVLSLVRDPRLGNDPILSRGAINIKEAWWVPKGFKSWLNALVFKDGADHSRLRKLVSKAFKPAMVKQWEARIADITNELLDEMNSKESVDFLHDFAAPLPLIVIAEIMGVSEDKVEEFAKYSNQLIDKMPYTYWDLLLQLRHYIKMHNFLEELVELKRITPGEDLTSALIAAEEDGDKLSTIELTGMLLVLLAAGHETTINLLAGGLLALLINPDQIQRFKDNPDLCSPMIEELLRYTNPVQSLSRYAKEDFEFNGNQIKKGDHLALYIGSANRDGTQFESPDSLDIGRSPNNHLAFGLGQHFCLGAQLARLEGKIAFSALFNRYPNIELAVPASTLKWRESRIMHGLAELPVRLNS